MTFVETDLLKPMSSTMFGNYASQLVWLRENIGVIGDDTWRYDLKPYGVWFARAEDATAFKLRFGL